MTQPSSSNDQLSSIFSSIYYSKKSLKLLLEQRSHIITKLNLKPQRGHFQQILQSILLLFNEPPLQLQPANLLVLKQSTLYYIFFSTDYKYIPMCKVCGWSVYISRNLNKGKIICCNPKCKRAVLEEFEVRAKSQGQMEEVVGGKAMKRSESVVRAKQEQPTQSLKNSITLDKEEVLRAIDRILK